eukprot:1005853_1
MRMKDRLLHYKGMWPRIKPQYLQMKQFQLIVVTSMRMKDRLLHYKGISITALAEEQAAIYTALQDKLDALQAKLDGLGPVVPAAAVEEGQRSIGIVDFNVFKEYQSELIALSIITNVIACFCLVSQRRGSKVYSPVQMYGFEDENAQSDADKI